MYSEYDTLQQFIYSSIRFDIFMIILKLIKCSNIFQTLQCVYNPFICIRKKKWYTTCMNKSYVWPFHCWFSLRYTRGLALILKERSHTVWISIYCQMKLCTFTKNQNVKIPAHISFQKISLKMKRFKWYNILNFLHQHSGFAYQISLNVMLWASTRIIVLIYEYKLLQ